MCTWIKKKRKKECKSSQRSCTEVIDAYSFISHNPIHSRKRNTCSSSQCDTIQNSHLHRAIIYVIHYAIINYFHYAKNYTSSWYINASIYADSTKVRMVHSISFQVIKHVDKIIHFGASAPGLISPHQFLLHSKWKREIIHMHISWKFSIRWTLKKLQNNLRQVIPTAYGKNKTFYHKKWNINFKVFIRQMKNFTHMGLEICSQEVYKFVYTLKENFAFFKFPCKQRCVRNVLVHKKKIIIFERPKTIDFNHTNVPLH